MLAECNVVYDMWCPTLNWLLPVMISVQQTRLLVCRLYCVTGKLWDMVVNCGRVMEIPLYLCQNCHHLKKEKSKGQILIYRYLHETGTVPFTISEVAVDWQEPVVLQRKCGHPLPALMDIGPAVAESKHTTAPINHTRPSPRKRSSVVTTPMEIADTRLMLTTHLSTSKG